MKRVSLALALAALSVPAAAGATQTSSHPASPSKASASHVKVYGTVTAITSSAVKIATASKSRTFARRAVSLNGIRVGSRVEAEGAIRNGVLRLSSIHLDDHAVGSAGSAKSSDDRGGDNRGGDNRGGDDNGGRHTGDDDDPGHH